MPMKASGGALALALSLAALPAAALAPLPSGWPYQTTLELGVNNSEPAPVSRSWSRLAFRYAYFTTGWRSWSSPDGQFAAAFIRSTAGAGMTPVITFYEILTIGGSPIGGEGPTDLRNLADPATMRAYYGDFKMLLQKAAGFPNNKVIVHVEPDLWGYVQQRAAGDDAATVPAAVGSIGLRELAGLSNTAAGFAQALVRMRDLYAPNVILGYHFSGWGTRVDLDRATLSTVGALATRSADFYKSLRVSFDVTFSDMSDRDAGYRGSGAFWSSAKYDKQIAWLSGYATQVNQRLVLWQIPLGNRVMRSMNNTTNHYQSFQVEDLLGDPAQARLRRYRDTGVIALIFGPGASNQTHYTDRAKDGVTNPAPINGNDQVATVIDDDGGYFRERVKAYYAEGALPLDGGGTPSPSSP
jgi:hypothetical protein